MKQNFDCAFRQILLLCLITSLLGGNAVAQTNVAPECQLTLVPSQNEKNEIINAARKLFGGEAASSDLLRSFRINLNQYLSCLVQVNADYATINHESFAKPTETAQKFYAETDRLKSSSYFRALGLSPEDSGSQTIVAQIAFLLGNREAAANFATKAFALDPANSEAAFVLGKLSGDLTSIDRAIALDPKFAAAYRVKAEMLLSQSADLKGDAQLEKLAETLQTIKIMLALPSPSRDAELWREQQEALTILLGMNWQQQLKTVSPLAVTEPTTKRLHILSKPKPSYTDLAQAMNVSGTIRLLVIFGADKTIKGVLMMKFLPYGMTERTLKAAREIKFEPEMQKGVPVSTVRFIEYNFSMY